MPSASDLNHLEGLDWTRVSLEKRVCSDCGKEFGTRGEVESHLPCVNKLSVTSNGVMWYICKCCHHEWCSPKSLCWHLNSQYNEKIWQCNHCLWKFTTKGNLYKHLREVHYSKTCPMNGCCKKFTSRVRLLKHGVKTHGCRFSECASCNKIYTQSHVCRRVS